MKAIIINGNIKTYNVLPKTWKNILNFRKATETMIKLAGFYDVVVPEYDPVIQELGDIYFDETNKVFTYPVVEKTLPEIEVARSYKLAELKRAVRDLYETVQWYLEMKRTDNEPIPNTVKTRLRTIKSKYRKQRDLINSLDNTVDILRYQIPYDAIDTVKSNLENLM